VLRLPSILSQEEVSSLIESAPTPFQRTLLMALYATGLRRAELARLKRAAAWGLIALLIAVFPANIYMATHPIDAGAASIAPVLRWGRLPLQLLLVLWLL
jgi:hypothetical protein